MKYTMTCTCGDVMPIEADSREAAVEMLKGQMTEEAVAKHFAEKHADQAVPSVEEVHAMIDQNVQEEATA